MFLLSFLSGRVFWSVEFADLKGSLQLLTSSHLRERDKMLLRGIFCGAVWNGFFLGKAKKEDVPCRVCGQRDGDGHLFWECAFSLPPACSGPPRIHLSYLFRSVALYVSWCRHLDSLPDVKPQLYADNLKCSAARPRALFESARFTAHCVRSVGQDVSPGKCVSKTVRKAMKLWDISGDGCFWQVQLDIRGFG